MKKTTAYARKRQRTGSHFNGAAWANVVQMCRPYAEDVPLVIPGLIEGTQGTGDTSLEKVQQAYAHLLTGAGTTDDFDLLAWAFGTGCARAGQIGPVAVDQNELLPPLVAGNVALARVLQRWRRFGKWQLLSADTLAIDYAVEVYGVILLASSPAQMQAVDELHGRWLQGRELAPA
jgi:hypothetical protein